MKNLQKLLIFLVMGFCAFACQNESEPDAPQILLQNNSDLEYTDAPVTISFQEIQDFFPDISSQQFPLLMDSTGQIIPSQTDDLDFNGIWDEYAFVYSVPANAQVTLNLKLVPVDSVPVFPPRTNVNFGVRKSESETVKPVTSFNLAANQIKRGGYNPYQMDGVAWENDKIGFRHYFDGRNTRDLFGKLTETMVLDTVGISDTGEAIDDYHVMEPWGRDVLSVGTSLGAGGLGVKINGQTYRLGIGLTDSVNNIKESRYRLINEGPVRSLFQLVFEDWQVGQQILDVAEVVSIWAGQNYYQNQITLTEAPGKQTLVVGLVNSNNDRPLMVLEENPGLIALATHDKQTYEKEFYLGLALILPKDHYQGYDTAPDQGEGITTSYNALIALDNQNSFTFYTLAGWGMSDERFKDRNYFESYVRESIQKLNQPLQVTLQ
ncbi:MAG: DUF4861 domain-containing protein [Candidatus Cyclobacteriaceae bacterium M3_2C_046]